MKTRLFNFGKFSTSTLLLMSEHENNLWYWGSVYAGDGYSIIELLPYVNSPHGSRRKVAG